MQWVLAAGPAYYGGGLSLQAIRDTLVVVLDALDSMVSVAMIIMSYMFFCLQKILTMYCVIGCAKTEQECSEDGETSSAVADSSSNRRELRAHAISMAEILDAILLGGQV